MTANTGVNLRWTTVALGVSALLATGAGATYMLLRPGAVPRSDGRSDLAPAPASGAAASTPAPATPAGAPLADVVITLGEDAVKRAGLAVSSVTTGRAAEELRLPGAVEPNAYRQVIVTPLVSGRITSVLAQLGQRVRRGETMAQVFSPELSEAHTRYTAARAELSAHERELERTEKLVGIGAASLQELERIHAEHTAKTADVQSARSRLELLGVPAATLDVASGGDPTADVPAPIDGVVTERQANVGLNVDLSSKLFTVVDLSNVWVVADLYEKDFSRVRVGSPARVTSAAYPALAFDGRVGYIDPQVSAQTRTARLRVEVPNPRSELRLGMYADVRVTTSGDRAAVPMIPRSAAQNVGDRFVVYVVDAQQAGRFTEREVRLGAAAGALVQVLSGLKPGDIIVTEGSFFLRAERERLGTRAASPPN